jgi:oligoribonuclease NrnB/cAMP/cGMP phosphodiesterase (DHH superfamily)
MITVYYHADMDGICSASIINKVYGDANCIPVQYNKDTWNLQDVVDADEVYVVDFTFPDIEELAKIARDKLHWIDHHKTAMEAHRELWDSEKVNGYRSLDNSGCGLTWKYCYNEEMPDSVKFIEDRDLWKFKFENTKAFCAGISQLIEDPYDPLWESLLDGEYAEEIKLIELGEILLKRQAKRVEHLFDDGFPCEIHGHNALLVNSTSDISELGEYIYTHDFELAVIWSVRGDNVIVSLRSNTVDCAEIAKKYGGGGHLRAAGFSIPNSKYFPLELF